MEKRVLLAALLCAIFLSLYSQAMGKRFGAQRKALPASQPGAPQETLKASQEEIIVYPLEKEDVTSIENARMAVEIGAKSGAIRRVQLKEFRSGSQPHLDLSGTYPLIAPMVGTAPADWKLAHTSQSRVELVSESSVADKHYHINYEIDSHNTFISIELSIDNPANVSDTVPVNIIATWQKVDMLEGRYNALELFALSKNDSGKKSYKRFSSPVKQSRNVPRGTFQLSLTERHFCQSIKTEELGVEVRLLRSPEGTMLVEQTKSSEQTNGNGVLSKMQVYFGPRDYFYLRESKFEEAFPIGAVGQIGLILLSFLNFVASLTGNIGLAIIAFSAIITGAMAPFTLLSMRSMKKMQELKPNIDRIMAKHKGDPKQANQAVFALYKEHKVSPLSGCLPMLLQLPIFIALLQAISHYVKLRGATFLWIKDLSLPDRMATLPFSLPILGNDVNLLPIIMAVAMYFQTKLSQQAPLDSSNPSAKMLSGPVLPIIFGVMFYQFPSGLVLYWLTNTAMSLLLYRIAK